MGTPGRKSISIIPGTNIGLLTVIEQCTERKNNKIIYICKCQCGNSIKVMASNLRERDGHHSNTRSCGCNQRSGLHKLKDLTGKKIGRLTVEKRTEFSKIFPCGIKPIYWTCICECGNKKVIDGSALKNRKTKSCGCLLKEVSREHCRKIGLKNRKDKHVSRLR